MSVIPNMTIITNGTIEDDGVVYPVLQLEVIPGASSEPEHLGFTWNATD